MPSWLHRILALVPVVALLGAAWLIDGFLAEHSYADLTASIDALTWPAIAVALGLTALSFAVLAGYDLLGARYARAGLPVGRVVLAGPVIYALSNALGVSALTSGALRLRFYRDSGAAAVARMTLFGTATLWIGPVLLLPAALWATGFQTAAILAAATSATLAAGLLTASLWWRRPLTVGGVAFAAPPAGIALGQIVLSIADWALAASVFAALIPADAGPPSQVFAAFLIAQTLGLFSHLPGGVGVFEATVVALLGAHGGAADLAGPLLAYRVIYYLLPLALASLALAAAEVWQRRALIVRLHGAVAPGLRFLTPKLLGAAAFAVGVVLLVSAVTPGVAERLDFLDDFLPIEVIELSHLASVAAGIALLFLARGLARCYRDAFMVTLVMLGVGLIASLLKGVDYEEAIVAGLAIALLWPARGFFYRRAGMLKLRLTPFWIAAIAGALTLSVWLGFYVFRDVPYDPDLLTTTAIDNDAGRFLRALMLGGVLLFSGLIVFFLGVRRDRSAPLPAAGEMEAAALIVERAPATYANLALLGDKRFLFDPDRRGFIMYAASGRSWVALGDPVAPDEAASRDLIWRFLELCDAHDAWPVFYQAAPGALPLYLDAGLAVNKLGEEALVDLQTFTLEGGRMAGLRQSVRAAERRGMVFSIAEPDSVPALIGEMRAVSDAWLGRKAGTEKSFSLGRFDPLYLMRFPVALVRAESDGRLLAFANLWRSGGRAELSVDLMRHVPDAPPGLMDLLFVRLMQWGKAEGYRSFNLGMAPMAGLAGHRLAPLWHRAGSYVFSRWGALYNFQGLRAYKQKFQPRWEARYLVSPGGAPLARVLMSVTSLVSGGLMGVIRR